MVVEQDEDGCHLASAPHLQGCHTPLSEAVERIREASVISLEAQEQPLVAETHFVGVHRVVA